MRTLTQQQQIITLRNDLAKQKINLARLTGLPPNPDYQLTDSFPFSPAPVAERGATPWPRPNSSAPTCKAAQVQVEAAAKALAAARAERLPSLSVSGELRGDRHQPRAIARRFRGRRHAQHSGVAGRASRRATSRRPRRCWRSGGRNWTIRAGRSKPRCARRISIWKRPRDRWRWRARICEVARGGAGDDARAHGSRRHQYGGSGAGAADGRHARNWT